MAQTYSAWQTAFDGTWQAPVDGIWQAPVDGTQQAPTDDTPQAPVDSTRLASGDGIGLAQTDGTPQTTVDGTTLVSDNSKLATVESTTHGHSTRLSQDDGTRTQEIKEYKEKDKTLQKSRQTDVKHNTSQEGRRSPTPDSPLPISQRLQALSQTENPPD